MTEAAIRRWSLFNISSAGRALLAERDELKAQNAALREALDSPKLLEALAAAEHERWARWMEYQSRAPAEKAADWPRKAATPYAMLTDAEKESDRIEARKSLAIVRAALSPRAGEEEQ